MSDSNRTLESILSHQGSEVKRTQKVLIFSISIVLSIYIISFITIIYLLSVNHLKNTYEPIIIIFWILFFASGMLVTKRYYQMGLFVFAWFGIVNVILTCILSVFVTVGIVIITSQSSKRVNGIPFPIIPIVTCLISVILNIVIVILSFKLWYLIKKTKKSNNHQRI